ncbi:hypothetical protein LXA47_08020 [Massilia sp. P8910]|uniref:hypothetical protein n=1 Tax=Massilia antarctica TaxID=2765360 RepID=UPI001E2DEEF7|nr:hypothetical protein [Massilia antarctica]MCE3603552.1 hypothetical protein [Massilia antarctica]
MAKFVPLVTNSGKATAKNGASSPQVVLITADNTVGLTGTAIAIALEWLINGNFDCPGEYNEQNPDTEGQTARFYAD